MHQDKRLPRITSMEKSYHQIFQQSLPSHNPPHGLETAILSRIRRAEKNAARTRFVLLTSLATSSLFSMIPSVTYLLNSFSQSGFYHYLSLIISDNTVLALYWKELTLSLIESLPLLGLIAFLSATAVFVWSGTKALRDARTAFLAA